MTPDEHKLIITMFAKQYQQIMVIIEILKSRGLLEGDDPMAFATVVHSDTDSNALVFQQAAALYLEAATHLAIDTGLGKTRNPRPTPPDSPR
jgi:hypothetical protein